jgi:hypothetical protein
MPDSEPKSSDHPPPDTRSNDDYEAYYERTRAQVIPRPEGWLGRFGCGVLLVVWFAVMLLPCALIGLAFNGEITIPHGNVPEPAEHPLFQVRLIMEIENRGLQFTRTGIHPESDTAVCVQSTVTYLLWQQEDDQETSVVYCDCYERPDSQTAWVFTDRNSGACP